MSHLVLICFLFALGACIGSFLNVVVWRLPRGESIVTPPSHCPQCNKQLKWYDNIPVLGWIKLGGKCRYCRNPISSRYPIVESVTGLLFVFYYVMFFMLNIGPCAPSQMTAPLNLLTDWPIYALCMLLLCMLLAASLIDAELFIIPIEMLWDWRGGIVWIALLVHCLVDSPHMPGALNASPAAAALALGASAGLIVSVILLYTGRLPQSFAEGGPALEVDRAVREKEIAEARRQGRAEPPPPREFTPREIRREMRKEMLFLLPPLAGGLLWLFACAGLEPVRRVWEPFVNGHDWVSGLLGAALGGLVGGFTVWLTRILGTLGFGREAMGMGDVHLMAGVGAAIGAGASVVAFFLAPFFGIIVAIYMLATGTKRELPYGPYLSLGTAFAMLFYCPIADYMGPGLMNLVWLVKSFLGGAGA